MPRLRYLTTRRLGGVHEHMSKARTETRTHTRKTRTHTHAHAHTRKHVHRHALHRASKQWRRLSRSVPVSAAEVFELALALCEFSCMCVLQVACCKLRVASCVLCGVCCAVPVLAVELHDLPLALCELARSAQLLPYRQDPTVRQRLRKVRRLRLAIKRPELQLVDVDVKHRSSLGQCLLPSAASRCLPPEYSECLNP